MLDFTKKKKRTYLVKLHDGFVAVLHTPSKKLYDQLIAFEGETGDEVYSLLAAIVNQNKKKTYTKAVLEEMFDLEDALNLIRDYLKFVSQITNDPN